MSWTATRRNASSQPSSMRVSTITIFSLRRLGGATAGAHETVLERGSTKKLAALNGVAGLTGSGRSFPGAFGDGGSGNPGSKIAAVPERIHLNAEYRARGECGRGYTLLRHSRGSGHLDAPIDILPVFVLGEFAIGPDQIEMEFGMVGLSHELVGHAGQR